MGFSDPWGGIQPERRPVAAVADVSLRKVPTPLSHHALLFGLGSPASPRPAVVSIFHVHASPDCHLIDLLFLFYVRIIVCGLDSRPRVFLSSSSLFSLTLESSSSLSHPSIHQRPPCV